ncbi:conjugal transfer protein TraX [Rahnella sp. SL6]|uniref:TraX family protein n=2 Tax=Rahnella perminowiae TaxID=2816244 RepID=UPI001C2748E5|nr:TraX family protein [Rahnella perminowiae]MBU9809292.1 conjugal transfer protein TraX [Rahnella perminowiae]
MLIGQVRAVPGYFERMTPFSMDVLKCVALIAMLIDHMNDILLSPSSLLLYAVGRMAMPLFALIFAFNMAKQPGRAQELAKRQWKWAIITQPFFAFAFYGHQPWYALNILFVFFVCSQLIAWVYSRTKYSWIKSILLIALFAWPLSLASYGLAGIVFVLISVLMLASITPGRVALLLWVISLISLNAASLMTVPIIEVVVFAIIPTLCLPLFVLTLTDSIEVTGKRFLPRQTFYWLYCGHLLVLGIIAVLLRYGVI